MLLASGNLGAVPLAEQEAFAASPFVPADTILRQGAVARNYKLEFAIGGDLTQALDSSGNRVASVIAFGSQDTGFPASNVISGGSVPYDPTTDTDSLFWQCGAIANQFVTIDLGSPVNLNEVQVYLHPLQPTGQAYAIQGSNDNVTYTNLFSGSSIATKNIVRFSSTLTYRYLKMVVNGYGSDGKMRVVGIKVLNWMDESARIPEMTPDSGIPDLTLDTKSDFAQSGLATASELQVVLMNEDGRYSPFNTASPLYGTTQVDGRGSGFRGLTPVRVTWLASATVGGTPASTSTQYFFEGFLQNDDSAAGTQAIILNDPVDGTAKTATVICKSLMTLLNKTIDTPAYEGAYFDTICRDICYRCGIADQDINVQGMQQVVPWVGAGRQTGLATIQQMLAGQPFSRAYETYSPNATINFQNFGRSRGDIYTLPFFSGMHVLAIPGAKKIYNVDTTGNSLWVWDQTKSFGTGVTKLGSLPGSPFPFTNLKGITVIGYVIYVYATDGHVYTWDTRTPYGFTDQGILDAALSSTGVMCVIGARYLLLSGVVTGTAKAYLWDTTKAYSSRTTLGTIPNAPMGMSSDGTYAVMAFFSGTNQTLYLWKHNGTPATASFTLVTYGPTASIAAMSPALGPSSQLYFFASATSNPTVWKLDLGNAYTNPGTTSPVSQGTLPVQSGGSSAVSHAIFNGSYMYILFHDATIQVNTAFVWDTAKAFTFLFNLGIQYSGRFGTVDQEAWYQRGSNDPSYFDYQQTVWSNVSYSAFSTITAGMTGFKVQGINVYPTSPNYSFDVLDGFTSKMDVSDGNPISNRIQITDARMGIGTSPSSIWNLATSNGTTNVLNVLANQKNVFPLVVPLSARGRDLGIGALFDGNLRTIILNQQSATITAGGATTTVTIASTAGLSVGQPVFLAGGTLPEVRTILSMTGTTLTFAAVSGSTHTAVVFSQYTGGQIADNPNAAPQNVTIGGVTYPCTFWGFGAYCFLTIDATGLAGCQVSVANIYGTVVAPPSASQLAVDQLDTTSKRLYKNKEFTLEMNNPFFNDLSFWQDLLLNGKYAQSYLQELDTPWYPPVLVASVVGATDATFGLSGAPFEVVEVKHTGFDTAITGKNVLSVYKI